MWDMILILLDQCQENDCFYFEKLDPPLKNINKHPLMLMAKSGQETILKHPTVQKLLWLKWRFIPRFAFYSNLFFYLTFLLSFSIYSLGLSDALRNQEEINSNDTEEYVYDSEMVDNISSNLILIFFIFLNLFKNALQIILIDRLSFFNSMENMLEIFTYLLALFSIFSYSNASKLEFCSIAVLFSFIVFTFLIQKLRVFGLYVLAFRRTLQNSTKFFPIFLIIFIGFNLSFRLQTTFAESIKQSTEGGIFLKTFVMSLGDVDTELMGFNNKSFYVNYLIYFLFMAIVCIIIVNLFVGIAVGEITTVLNEADVQQISMRIIFVLKVQESLKPFTKRPLIKKFLDIKFDNFTNETEYRFIRTLNLALEYLKKKFSSVEPSIELMDPQQRLEDGLAELSRSTQGDLKRIRESISHQLTDVEYKLTNSQQRIADCLVQMNTKTTTNFETTKEESSDSLGLVVIRIEKFLNQNFLDIKIQSKCLSNSLKYSFKSLISNFDRSMHERSREIQQYLETFYKYSKINNEENKQEVNDIKLNLKDLVSKLDQMNFYLEKIRDKLNILESNTDLNFDKAKLIQNALDETNQKIEHQKKALEQLPKYQPKIIINNLKENSIRRSIMNLFNQNIPIEAQKDNDNITELFKDEPEIFEKESNIPKQTILEPQDKIIPFTEIKEAFKQTPQEIQFERSKEIKTSEIKSEESNRLNKDLETTKKSVSPWLKRRLKQRERKKQGEKQPEVSDDEN